MVLIIAKLLSKLSAIAKDIVRKALFSTRTLKQSYSHESHLMKTTLALDRGGVLISSLCLIHCLFLPLFGTFVPLLGVWSEIEWIHKTFVLMAFPLCLNLIFQSRKTQIRIPAILGFSLLFSGAFVHALHDFEVMTTVIGAISLSFAHLQNIHSARHRH